MSFRSGTKYTKTNMKQAFGQQTLSAPRPCVCRERGCIEYQEAHDLQLKLLGDKVANPELPDQLLMLEHPPVYTLGRQGRRDSLLVSESWLQEQGVRVVQVERGGDITFHGPGQLVVYPIFDLKRARMAVTELVHGLEQVMIQTAAAFGVKAHRKDQNRGVWIGEQKVGSVGLAVRRGISFHGLACNINCSLEPFTWINHCGHQGVRMTSLEQAARNSIPMPEARCQLKQQLQRIFQLEWQDEEARTEVSSSMQALVNTMTLPCQEQDRSCNRSVAEKSEIQNKAEKP